MSSLVVLRIEFVILIPEVGHRGMEPWEMGFGLAFKNHLFECSLRFLGKFGNLYRCRCWKNEFGLV